MMRPGSEEELAGILRAASGPLRIRGGGTRSLADGAGKEAEVLDTSALSGIRLYEPAALTLVAGAGTPLAEVEAALAAEGQRLAFEPPDLRALLGGRGISTIGGVVAANASGPRRVQAGACRDSLIGVRFVDGTGAVVKNGGRVMKNVTGYDLVKLMAGSQGRLGVLTEVSFKVQPVPPAVATLVLPAETADDAVAVLSAALGSPFDVSGAAWVPARGALIRIEGLAASVGYRAERLAAQLGRFGAAEIITWREGETGLWADVRDVTGFACGPGDVWRISVKPSDAPEVARRLGCEVMLDWGGGLVWARMPEGAVVRERLAGIGGHATRLRGAGPEPALPPEAPAIARLSDAIRDRFDPRGLFRPAIPAAVPAAASDAASA